MLHQLLTQNRDEIVQRCAQRYQERYPERPRDELLDTIPSFVDDLIRAERREAGLLDDEPDPDPEARSHGEQRFRHGFPIAEVIRDYGAVCDIIGELAIEQRVTFDAPSYKLLNACLDNAMAHAITEYFALSRASQERAVAEWVGTLGHEARNALGSATMAYSVIRSGKVGLGSRTAEVLERSLNRLDALISQTLAAVQLDSGAMVHAQRVHLRDLFAEIEAAALLERGITICTNIPPELVAQAALGLADSIFTNLLQNAIKYTRTGGMIEIRAFRRGEAVVVEIEDECGGLEVDARSMFDPFVQGKNGRRGIGMGLAITQRAVAAIGGAIGVRDLAPKGCVFSVELPPAPRS